MAKHVRATPPLTVLNAYTFADNLPGSIDAFFWLANDDKCTSVCMRNAQQAHASFLETYPDSQVPLLGFDPGNAEQPFSESPVPQRTH